MLNRGPQAYARMLAGLVLIAAGTAATVRAGLGLDPWDVLHDGIHRHTPLTFGQAVFAVSLATLVLTWKAGERPGIATVANMLLVGPLTDMLLATGAGSGIAHAALTPRVVLLLAGLVTKSLGIGAYLSGGLGAGPRDAAQLTLSRRLHAPAALARAGWDCLGLATGMLLGGHTGLGTLLSVAVIGPTLAACFRLAGLQPGENDILMRKSRRQIDETTSHTPGQCEAGRQKS